VVGTKARWPRLHLGSTLGELKYAVFGLCASFYPCPAWMLRNYCHNWRVIDTSLLLQLKSLEDLLAVRWVSSSSLRAGTSSSARKVPSPPFFPPLLFYKFCMQLYNI